MVLFLSYFKYVNAGLADYAYHVNTMPGLY